MERSKKALIGIPLIIFVALSSFATLAFMQAGKASPNPIVMMDPTEIVIPFCEIADIAICVENFTGLRSFQFKIWWLKDVVNYTGYEWKPYPPEWPSPLVAGPDFEENATHKAVSFGITSFPPAPFSYSGRWPFIDIYWHCIKPGVASHLIFDRDSTVLFDIDGLEIPIEEIIDGLIINPPYWEPIKLIDIVEWPGIYALVDIPFVPPGTPEGYTKILMLLEDKGYTFDPTTGNASEVSGTTDEGEFSGTVTSWWSSNTLEDGTRACMLSAEMDDGTSMAMAFVTNLLPPEQVPGVDPHIIVNAMPYMYVRFYWWAWPPIGRIISWPYWWYDSHSHPNWFWGPYWWWRVYTKAYILGIPYPWPSPWAYWRPWWGWWWHWVYWRHWYWWSTYFPYDP